jgi:hypothetical protein
MPFKDKPAFRCRSCGHLEGADSAGEGLVPTACSVCDAGVDHDPEGRKMMQELADPKTDPARRQELLRSLTNRRPVSPADKRLVPENWEVLADCDPRRLKELGLAAAGVARHAPFKTDEAGKRSPIHVRAEASESVSAKHTR